MLSIKNVDMRRAETLLADMPDLIASQTYGDGLNLIISGDVEKAKVSAQSKLHEAGFTEAMIESMSIRMEEAFIYLVEAEAGKEKIS